MEVTIRCLVFNHAPYLRQCLNSLVSQQVNFDYEIVVHDDASTDGSQDIIREYAAHYPQLIKPILEEQNQYSLHNGAIRRIMDEATTGRYAAFCEGDDFWTDVNKLQKQVDFLEAHPDYSMVHTSYRFYYQDIEKFIDNDDVAVNGKYADCAPEKMPEVILLDYRVKTATVLLRTEMLRQVRKSDDFLYKQDYFLMGDTPLWFGLACLGAVKFMPEVTAVYRKHNDSLTKQTDLAKSLRFTLNSYELRYYLAHQFDFSDKSEERFRHLYTMNLLRYLSVNQNFKPIYPPDPKTAAEKFRYFLLKIHLLKICLKLKQMIFRMLGPLKRSLVRHQ